MSLLKKIWKSWIDYNKKLDEERMMQELMRMEPAMAQELNALRAKQN